MNVMRKAALVHIRMRTGLAHFATPGGDYGGGSETLVVQSEGLTKMIHNKGGLYAMTTGDYMTISEDQTSTLLSRDYKDPQCVSYEEEQHYIVRRLTPLECERLQGFPDGWTDIGTWTDKKGKEHDSIDSARYKALGNSIAIPPWFCVLQRLSLACGADKTMASLFDGIGGFPLIWSGLHGNDNCVWASEIEDFPIAVTKKHFPEDE